MLSKKQTFLSTDIVQVRPNYEMDQQHEVEQNDPELIKSVVIPEKSEEGAVQAGPTRDLQPCFQNKTPKQPESRPGILM